MKGIFLLFFIGAACAWQYEVKESEIFGYCKDVNHGVFPHPDECDKYVLCLFYNEMVVNCPPNNIYDPESEDCCPGDPETCNPEQSTTVPTTVPTTTPTTTPEPTTPNWRDECEQGEIGNKEYPGDCRLYIACFLGFASLKQCPQGQIFVGVRCVPGDPETCLPN